MSHDTDGTVRGAHWICSQDDFIGNREEQTKGRKRREKGEWGEKGECRRREGEDRKKEREREGRQQQEERGEKKRKYHCKSVFTQTTDQLPF